MTKKIISALFTLLLFTSLAGVTSAQSQDGEGDNQGRRVNQAGAAFCERISDRLLQAKERVTERVGRIEDSRAERKDRRESKWEEYLSKREERRTTRDTNLEEHFAKLEERAQTDAEKQAVLDFIAAVREAIEARRLAFDQANTDFRNGVQTALDERNAAIEAATQARIAAFDAAVQKAKTDCTGGVDPKTVKENLVNNTKAATEAFKAAVEDARNEFKSSFESLKSEKKTALDEARETFQSAIEAAKDTLKQAFGETDDESDNSGNNDESED